MYFFSFCFETLNEALLFIENYTLQKRNNTYNVFMLRMALRDIIASVTAFLNCLREKRQTRVRKDVVRTETTWRNKDTEANKLLAS